MSKENPIVATMNSSAMVLQPGDATRYEMVVVETWDCFEVVVLNDSFFDKITFLKHTMEHYKSYRGEKTNPWTIKAAKIALKEFLSEKEGI